MQGIDAWCLAFRRRMMLTHTTLARATLHHPNGVDRGYFTPRGGVSAQRADGGLREELVPLKQVNDDLVPGAVVEDEATAEVGIARGRRLALADAGRVEHGHRPAVRRRERAHHRLLERSRARGHAVPSIVVVLGRMPAAGCACHEGRADEQDEQEPDKPRPQRRPCRGAVEEGR